MKPILGVANAAALLAGLVCASVPGAESPPLLRGQRALIVLAAKGFRDEEYAAVATLFRQYGIEVVVASNQLGKARGMGGAEVMVSQELSTVRATGFHAVVFIGGAGARTLLWDNVEAQRLAREAAASPGVLGAICYAPCVLAKAGVLKGHTAAVYQDRYSRAVFAECGVRLATAHVVVAGRLVTADGPESAAAFAEALVRLLSGPSRKER